MKLNTFHALILAAPRFVQKPLSISSLVLLTGVMTSVAHAQLASQVFPVQYQAGSYCSSDLKGFVPKGTQNKDFVADVSCIREQLKPFQAENQPTNTRFQAYKANAWLSYVAHEDNEASLTRAGHYALGEALSILEALKTNQADKLPLTADIPPTSGLQRPDLWATLLTIKQTPAFAPLVKAVADSEVKLIWAEAEFCEFGWRHSREHYSAADRWVSAAQITAINTQGVDKADFDGLKRQYLTRLLPLTGADGSHTLCRGTALPYVELPKVVPQPVLPVVVLVPAPVITPAPIELEPAIVHFALDKSNLDQTSRQLIDVFLDKVASYPNANDYSFGLYGHTDSRASVAYNNALSKRRTSAVASYLVAKGIDSHRISEFPKGKDHLKRSANDVQSHSLNRRVEIYLLKDGVPVTNTQVNDAVLNQSTYSDLKLEKPINP